MSEPQHGIRAYLEDGPHAGETLSVPPEDNGSPPGKIVVDGDGGADPGGVSEPTADDDTGGPGSSGRATYRLGDRDLENGVYRYHVAP